MEEYRRSLSAWMLQVNTQAKQSMKGVTRGVVVLIMNNTNFTLFRTNFDIESGKWTKFPADSIPPRQHIQVICESNMALTGTGAWVEYKMRESRMPFCFQWNNPYLLSKACSFGSNQREDGFNIDCINSEADITEILLVVTDPLNRNELPILHQPVAADLWKIQLSKSRGSPMLVTLHNNTRMNMERVNYATTIGIWKCEPPSFIGPETIVEFGTDSDSGFSPKTRGYVTYKYLEGEKKDAITRSYNFIKITWGLAKGAFPEFMEEKVDGFGNYYFTISHAAPQGVYNAVTWTITEKMTAFTPQISPAVVASLPDVPIRNSGAIKQAPQTSASTSAEEQAKIEKEVIGNLNKQAEEGLPATLDNQTGLNVYYHMATQCWENGMQAKKVGDNERAYISFLKFTTLVLEKIPTHLSYSNARWDNDKTSVRSKLPRVMQDLESIQKEVVAKRVNEYINTKPKFVLPDVPVTTSTPLPSIFGLPQNPTNETPKTQRQLDGQY